MEGDGEGMVAIVQGLRDAGLAVTLMRGRRTRAFATAPKHSSQVAHGNTTMETSTSASPASASVDTAAQICDDRYTSSYQIAHCCARPSSPPVELAEFPPQRSETWRTLGNFEIGTGNGEVKSCLEQTSVIQSHANTLKNSFTCVNRGHSLSRSSRGTEAFAHTLRKYPSVSPDRSTSTELVQRLLVYTQAKNFSKSSYHSKSMRSLRAKMEASKEVTPKTKTPKDAQAVVNTKVKESAPLPEGEKIDNIKVQNKKKTRAQSPVTSAKDIRYKDNHINTTFDYLKSTSPRRFNMRASDVRYLTEMTRCLRDTLRQICDERPHVCPSMQNRYSQHRREHHGLPAGQQQASFDSNITELQESLPVTSTDVPVMSSCDTIRGTYRQTCSTSQKNRCYCRKSEPSSCTPRSSVQFQRLPKVISNESLIESNVIAKSRSLFKNESSCVCSGPSVDDFEKNVKDQVFIWLQEVPVYANDKSEDKNLRENMARTLVDKLKKLKDDKDVEDKAKELITECVNNMPMWCPGDKKRQDLFKEQIIDNLLNEILNLSNKVNKFENDIKKWVLSLNLSSSDSQGQIIDTQSITESLIIMLKPLALHQPTDIQEYKGALKTEIVNILERFPIKVDGDINDHADKLATQLHTIPVKDVSKTLNIDTIEDEFQKLIWEWLEDVPKFSSFLQLNNNQKLVESLANQLQILQAKGIDESTIQEQMQNEINEWLETNVEKDSRLDSETKNKLAKSLLGKLINASKSVTEKKVSKPLTENTIDHLIWDWLSNISELADAYTLDNHKMVGKLAKDLFNLRAKGKNNSKLEETIFDWLTTFFESKRKRIDIKTQNHLMNKLVDKINSFCGDNDDKNEQLIQNIWVCLKDVPELDVTSKESNEMVKILADKIQKFQSEAQRDHSEKEIKDQLVRWLDDLAKNIGLKISTKDRNQLMQKLMNLASSTPKQRKRWSNQDNLEQAITDVISSSLEGILLKLNNGNKNNLISEISKLLAQNLGTVRSGDVNDEIKTKILDIIQQDGQIAVEKASEVADDVINKLKRMILPELMRKVRTDQLENTLREEVGLILDESNVNYDDRDKIESFLTDILADQVVRGRDEKQSKDKLISALRNFYVSQEQSEKIATTLIRTGKEMSLGQKTQDSTIRLSSISKSGELDALSPLQKEIFKDSAERDIVDYLQDITGDSSVMSTRKYKAAAEKLAQSVSHIMCEKKTSVSDKRQAIGSEVSKCLQSLSISTDRSQVSQLADQLQNIAFKTSTPKRSSLNSGFSFRPQRYFKGLTISSIADASQIKVKASPSKEEDQYMKKLLNIIGSWMSGLPIDLDTEDENCFKEVMSRDLAGDIIDRQKYLQLNPEAKTSEVEELEHLKYQVFRWLNKLPGVTELMPLISKTDYLMERIKAVPVPVLIKTDTDRSKNPKDSYIKHLSGDLSSLQNEICKWFEAVPSKFYSTVVKDYHQQMIKKLAQQIDQLHREEALTETLLDDVVSEWLQNMLKEYSEEYFNSLSEGLKSVLINKGLIILLNTSPLTRPSSHVIQNSLRSIILDWLKEKPLYQRRLSREKREQEDIIAELSQILKDTIKSYHTSEITRDERILNEIKSHLIKLPMASHLKLDEEFHHSTANELLEHLKMLQVFQNIPELQTLSHSQVEAGHEEILPILEKWINSLPLQVRKTSVDSIKLDSLKQEFAKTLYQIKQQHPAPNETASEILKEVINNYLHKFPIQQIKKKNHQFVSDKVDELHKKLLSVQSHFTTSNRLSKSDEDLKEVILNWAEKLPFQPEKNIKIYKAEVDKIASKVKNILAHVPENGFENVKANLEKEIKLFIDRLPLQKSKIKDDCIKILTNQLNDFVETSYDTRPTFETVESVISSTFKKATDALHENIDKWCKNLPITHRNSPKEEEKVKTLKQNLASKLNNIIHDLNMNPDIFNDDLLYEDLLNDEINNLLNTLPLIPELDNNFSALKQSLIEKVKAARVITQDELAGQVYKQQLRDAISKTLPSLENLSIEEQAPFEVLKNNLADAFINLYYTAGNEELKIRLKNKIADEINQFCNDYLQRYPASPVDSKKINRDLYNVLQDVPAPKNETFLTQVKQVRIKDEINNWLKEIPLKEDQSPAEQLQKNKIVTVMSKRLYDIEKEKEYNPNIDVEGEMQKEIKKWMKKLSIKTNEEGKIDKMVEELTAKIKSTEQLRRFSVSNFRHSFETADDRSPCESICPISTKFDKHENPNDNRYLSQYAPTFPPSTLSTEDRAHLEMIRERNQTKKLFSKPVSPSCHCKDASVNPIPMDAGSQTDVGPGEGSGIAKSIQHQNSSYSRNQAPPIQSSDVMPCSQVPVSPQVFVKEYYWDSKDSALRVPGYTAPCGQENQFSSSQRYDQSYSQQPHQAPHSSFIPPRFGLAGQPSPCSGPQGIYPSPDQSRMSLSSCMRPPPVITDQPSYIPQEPRQPQSVCMSPTPQMVSQAPYVSHPEIRSPPSPCTRAQNPFSSTTPSMRPQTSSIPHQSSCMMSNQPPQVPPLMNRSQISESRYSNMTQYDKTPCMTTAQVPEPRRPPSLTQFQSGVIPRQGSQLSHHIPPCSSNGNHRRETKKTFRQTTPELSNTSSPFDTGPDAANGRYNPKVTRLGSLDDLPCTKNCGSQSPRTKRSRVSPDEDYEWTIRFPENDCFWGTPCPRRRVHRYPIRNSQGAFVTEKERKEEKMRCRCRKHILTKCMGRRPQNYDQSCQLDDESMNHCSKCCGAHCPNPSYLFFK